MKFSVFSTILSVFSSLSFNMLIVVISTSLSAYFNIWITCKSAPAVCLFFFSRLLALFSWVYICHINFYWLISMMDDVYRRTMETEGNVIFSQWGFALSSVRHIEWGVDHLSPVRNELVQEWFTALVLFSPLLLSSVSMVRPVMCLLYANFLQQDLDIKALEDCRRLHATFTTQLLSLRIIAALSK